MQITRAFAYAVSEYFCVIMPLFRWDPDPADEPHPA